jgi:23S rRNA (guanine2445-N2)-methyltransferase
MNIENEIKIVAKTSFGLEDVLIEELKQLGVTNFEKGIRAVTFHGNKEMLYKANLWLRTANRLLTPFREFTIKSDADLYDKIKAIEWESIFDIDQSLAIDSAVFSPLFNHTKYAAFKAKDAIVDRFRDKFGKRPNVDTTNPDIRINIHIGQNNKCTVSLDSSGDPLFKRGYRDSRSMAPIKEDLAAGMVLLSDWDKNSNFIDLFCGSGTLLIEAAMIACNIPPNINRGIFGFMNWKTFNEELFNQVVDEALDAEIDFEYKIIGIDNDARVMGMSRANIEAAGLTNKIELHKKEFNEFEAPQYKGIIVCNPPYGERIGENVDELYTAFGDNLKTQYDGWNAWMISSNMGALKKVGLRPSRKIKLFNGSLECRFMKYEMYKGTKKIHKLQKQDD